MKNLLIILALVLISSPKVMAKEMELIGYQETEDCKGKSIKVNSTIDDHGQQKYTVTNENCK